ncbi:MAG: DUF2029 domain-containing protein [Planctomycetes bacterium]|nr:DUF2029 domain-containing protein [Planctomycetota bacterium]
MTTPRRQAVHAVLPWILLGLLAWFAARGLRDALRPAGSDLTIYFEAGRAALAGRDPNGVEGWIYPPGGAWLFAACAWLPLWAFAGLFQAASLACLAWSARRLAQLVRAAGSGAPSWITWLPTLCVLRMADSNLTNGQVNHFTLAALVAALWAWERGRAGATGAWVGAAAAFKLLPGILALHFLLRRSWRALAASALTLVLGLVGAPLLLAGPTEGWAQLATWWHGFLAPHAAGGGELLAAREVLPGQSLPAALYRLLAAAPATARGAAGPTAAIAALDPDDVRWIVLAAQAAILAGLAATVLRSARGGAPGARLREAALCLACALLLAPLVHKAHMVWMLVPYAVLAGGAPPGLAPGARRARWALFALSALFAGASTPFLLGRVLATGALSHNAVGLGVLLGALALAVDVWGQTGRGAFSTALRAPPPVPRDPRARPCTTH